MTPQQLADFKACLDKAFAVVSQYRADAPPGFDPQNTFATIATVATIATAATALSTIGFQAAQGAPKTPDLASASREVSNAQAAALPLQRQLSAAEQAGGKALNPAYKQSTNGDQLRAKLTRQLNQAKQQMNRLPDGSNQIAGWQAKINDLNGQLSNIPAGSGATVYLNNKGKVVPASEAQVNFAGYGTADVEGKLAEQYAKLQTDLGAKYGVPFAEESAREAALADPEGTAARKAEYDLIQQQITNPPPINPLSGELQDQIDAQVKAGRGLDPMSQQLLDQSVAQANASRGGKVTSGQVATDMSQGNQGQARLEQALQKGQGFVSSGVSPADVEYRRSQQNIGNLGAFVGGQTPESQFQSLSGAGQGSTPFVPGQQLPSMPNNAATTGPAYSIQSYQDQIRAGQSQANPWLAGLSSVMTGVSALGQSKP